MKWSNAGIGGLSIDCHISCVVAIISHRIIIFSFKRQYATDVVIYLSLIFNTDCTVKLTFSYKLGTLPTVSFDKWKQPLRYQSGLTTGCLNRGCWDNGFEMR